MNVEKLALQIGESIRQLAATKARVAVLVGPLGSERQQIAKAVTEHCAGVLLDTINDFLPTVSPLVLGAYDGSQFEKDIVKLSDTQGKMVCLDDIDPLLATFDRKGAEIFFALASNATPRYPVLLVSSLTELLVSSGFDAKRVHEVGG